MNTRTRRPLWAVTALVLVAAAGCSDDSSDPSADESDAAPTTTAGAGSTAGATTTEAETTAAPETTAEAPADSSTDTSTTESTDGGEEETAAEEVLTPIIGDVNFPPTPVLGTDGRTLMAYELLLINATTMPATLDSVKVLDADTGDVLQEHTGDDLVGHSRVVGNAPTEPPTSVRLNGGQAVLVWVDPSVEDGEEVPTMLEHEISATFDEAPNPLLPAEVTETIVATEVSDVPAPVIASPLEGANWFDGNGCCDEVTPHVGSSNPINGQYYFAERYAVDWVQLDSEMRIYSGDPTELTSYAYYDAPIYAVADGTIVGVKDDLDDQVPGENPPPGALQVSEFGGNHVVQRFEQNGQTYYAFYAHHLVPGSAGESVKVGQEIKAGEVVGRLGNSGNSDSPHLHFHVMDSPNPLASNGLPYVFESLDLVGTTDDEASTRAQEGEPLDLTPDAPSGEQTDRMPLYLDVVDLQPAQP